MTKILDRLLGLAAVRADASAVCPRDSWTECKANSIGPNSWNRCTRVATQSGNCTITYSSWVCRCETFAC